jgi:hypothetical protein
MLSRKSCKLLVISLILANIINHINII